MWQNLNVPQFANRNFVNYQLFLFFDDIEI